MVFSFQISLYFFKIRLCGTPCAVSVRICIIPCIALVQLLELVGLMCKAFSSFVSVSCEHNPLAPPFSDCLFRNVPDVQALRIILYFPDPRHKRRGLWCYLVIYSLLLELVSLMCKAFSSFVSVPCEHNPLAPPFLSLLSKFGYSIVPAADIISDNITSFDLTSAAGSCGFYIIILE